MDAGCSTFLVVVIALAALIVAVVALQRARAANEEIGRLHVTIDVLSRRLSDLAAPRPAAAAAAPAPAPKVVVAPTPVAAAPPPKPTPPPAPPRRDAARPAGEDAGAPRVTERKPFDWEALIGVKLFSWIAGVALVLAAVFFLSYSVQHGWIRPWLRATIGLAAGTALIAVCETRMARGYKLTADAMDGAGIAILYATLFAAHALWHLAPAAAIFGAMLVVTAVAVALSIRRDSLFIALLGLLGGFATPALLSTGENKPIALFTYLLLLNIGLAWVAMTKRWPLLTALTVALTIVYEWSWLAKFLTPGQLPLAAAIFAAFALAAGATLFVGRRGDATQPRFDVAAVAGATMPLLFAVFGAAVPAYGARYNVLFGFLLLVTAALSIIAVYREPHWLHLGGGVATLVVLVVWLRVSYTASARPAAVAWLAVFIVVQLAASHFSATPKLSVAPALFVIFPSLLLVAGVKGSAWPLFLTMFALLVLVAAYALWHRSGGVYFVAAFFAVAAEGIWSAKFLDANQLYTAVAIYAMFGVLFAAMPAVARRLGRPLEPAQGSALLLLATIAMLFFLSAGAVAGVALWGLAVLLVIANAGALVEARAASNAGLAAAAALLSWIVIGLWFSSSLDAGTLIPALAVAAGFGLLSVGGTVWAGAGASERGGDFAISIFLALSGHLLLLVVAVRPALSFPPWPMFAVLLLLDLAIGAASVYTERSSLMASALVASQLVLAVWASTCSFGSWPLVALGAALGVAALGVAWLRFGRVYAVAALLGLFGGHVVAMFAGVPPAAPPLVALGATHVMLAIALLVILSRADGEGPPAQLPEGSLTAVRIVAVAFATVATAFAPTRTPGEQFLFALPFYVLFAAWPLVLGDRASGALGPYVAAVVASAVFFVFARRAMLGAHVDYAIGALPLCEAAVMTLLVWRLLRLERRGERNLTRLAIVAGAALAFLTVAIPLQLEKQWITIGWALEGAALVWLYRRVPHRGLLLWAGALLGAVFVRLAFNPAVFLYHPASHAPIVNWYLYTYLVAAAAFFAAAKLLPAEEAARLRYAVPALGTCGTVLLFFVLNIEIADFYSMGRALTFNFFSSSLAQDLTYTIGWALFAVAMLVAGIALHSRGTRIAAIVLLLVTVFKCFLHDLGRLGGLYRVASLLGLAVSIVLVAVLLQRFVIRAAPVEETP